MVQTLAGVVDIVTFRKLLPMLPQELADKFFRACDVSGSGTMGVLRVADFSNGIALGACSQSLRAFKGASLLSAIGRALFFSCAGERCGGRLPTIGG